LFHGILPSISAIMHQPLTPEKTYPAPIRAESQMNDGDTNMLKSTPRRTRDPAVIYTCRMILIGGF
jgi:hypothetical protein